jgi:hypothetical protein
MQSPQLRQLLETHVSPQEVAAHAIAAAASAAPKGGQLRLTEVELLSSLVPPPPPPLSTMPARPRPVTAAALQTRPGRHSMSPAPPGHSQLGRVVAS